VKKSQIDTKIPPKKPTSRPMARAFLPVASEWTVLRAMIAKTTENEALSTSNTNGENIRLKLKRSNGRAPKKSPVKNGDRLSSPMRRTRRG